MSEKLYRWLLRLYPSHFRHAYGDAALQLFRDRSRHERGFFPALRLWLDLLADLVLSVPRQYRRVQPALSGASALRSAAGTPSFYLLDNQPPRAGALLLGAVLSLAGAAASIPLSHLPIYRPFATPSILVPSAPGPAATGVRLDNAERRRVIHSVVANLKEHYVDPAVAREMQEGLLARDKAGDYQASEDGTAFAALLTRHLREVSHDLHLEVVYSRNMLPEISAGPSPERIAAYRNAMLARNCTFESVRILPHNIGYLKLNSFPEPSICGTIAKSAMDSLNRSDALIFDLRDNRGGDPAMVMLIAAYLFDHPEFMYRPGRTTPLCWTESPVPGNLLAHKPVYVLTSSRTCSAAEHFSYDLKMLKRATLVGERTAGATDVGVFHRLDDHFGIGIREFKSINPYSQPDWAVTGVQPDVKVPAADALVTAEKLAQTNLRK